MLKLELKLIFWSLAVHRYPKQPPRVIIFAAMGPGMKLVIDGNFLAEKNENLKIFCKTYVIYIKVKRNKVMKYELILSVHQGFTRDHLSGGGVFNEPPHV